MAVIETYLARDSDTLTATDLAELRKLSVLVEHYEDRHYPIPVKTG